MDDMKKEKTEMRWQMLMWRMVIIICVATFMLAWMMYGSESGDSGISVGAYVMRYIVTPIIIQIFTVIIGFFLIKSKKVSVVQKNYIVTAMIFIVLNVNALMYYKISPLILLPCLTIVATAMFADQLLTFWAHG